MQVPVVAKADSMTLEELRQFRKYIRSQLEQVPGLDLPEQYLPDISLPVQRLPMHSCRAGPSRLGMLSPFLVMAGTTAAVACSRRVNRGFTLKTGHVRCLACRHRPAALISRDTYSCAGAAGG